jgi:FMN phosphatase YigB (HAD superfamily)
VTQPPRPREPIAPVALEAIGFDFDHTLGLDHGLEATAFAELAADLGRPIALTEPPWSTTIPELLARFRGGELSVEDAVALFVQSLGVDGDPVDRAQQWREHCYALVPKHVRPVDGAREVLAALRAAGVPLAILTNGWSPLQEKKIAQALGDFPEPILVSEVLGVAKPDAAAFAKLADVLCVAVGAIAYVGDNPKTDVAGAQGAGLVGVWFDWEGISYPGDTPPAQIVIHALAEVAGLVPGRTAETENLVS